MTDYERTDGYIRRIRIENVRSIRSLQWELPADLNGPGWHVAIGDNGSGKSTFLRAIALALIGKDEAGSLRQDWKDWLTIQKEKGQIALTFGEDDEIQFYLERSPGGKVDIYDVEHQRHLEIFSASYGPFRRFSVGSEEQKRLTSSFPDVARHLSIFFEDVTLTEYLSWLQNLQFRTLELRDDADLLDKVRTFVNQDGFLPHQARLSDVSSEGVLFLDAKGNELAVESLSDGYRSILSMTFELIRQLAIFYGPNGVFDNNDPKKIVASGIVLIDEVDAHLHPTWQRRIGRWFREQFPNIQFFVSTHSPFICQAANEGTVFRLPRPGTDDLPQMLTGIALDRLLYGNVLDAYGTEAFGSSITSSFEARAMRQELAKLNVKELEQGLSKKELLRQKELRAAMPLAAYEREKDFLLES